MLDPWYGKGAVLAAAVAMVAIRAPHGQRSRGRVVRRSAVNPVEKVVLTFAMASFFVPFVWITTPPFAFADYPLRPAAWGAGVALLVLGLWIFHRSHADLGTNWSVTLQIRKDHSLVTGGIYRRIRHPMYLGLLLFGVGQVLALPNWLVGPGYLVAMLLVLATRIGPEERMMEEEFGDAWREYRRR